VGSKEEELMMDTTAQGCDSIAQMVSLGGSW
jgi:hypothetical protein